MPSPDLLEDLNPPQREAVLYGDGAMLVLAGAGSGKTRVITRRIAHLVLQRNVEPWRVLAVTFTNKAAREMKDRLEGLLGTKARDLVVSTFHSSAAMLLRRESDRAGLERSFVIYDDADQLQVVKRAMREAEVDLTLVNPRDLLSRIDQEKNAGRLPYARELPPEDYRGRQAQRVYAAYQKLLRAANAVDFGDLLLLLVDLLEKDEEVRTYYRRRFRYVLVDEFQDTNPVQYRLLQLLAPPGSNLVVVGDDDQSIYRWRGAEVDNILEFPRDYPGTKVVKLEQNYRSDQNILEAANAVISRNSRRMEKKLWSSRPHGERLQLILARDERGEAQEIARRIRLLTEEGVTPFSQVAVFYRVNAQSRVLEETMRLSRIPYALINGRSFYERAEVKDASAYLRLMVNPRSDADLLRVINTPGRGIGDTTVERLEEHARGSGLSLFEALAQAPEIGSLNAGAVKRLTGFRGLVERLRREAAQATDAAGAVEKMLEVSGLLPAYEAEGTDEASARAENLRELLGAAQEFDLSRAAGAAATPAESLATDVPPLQAFLEQISLVSDADQDPGEGKVSLMTLHAAKGLEFDAVFLTGMEESVFPHQRALKPDAAPEELEEERRLCYVGFTRARRHLFVSLAQARSLFGELKFNEPSRFLGDVPKELFDLPSEDALSSGRTYAPVPPRRRRSSYDEEDGPRIDRSYSQVPEFADAGDAMVGLRVRHSQFGDGEIVSYDGQGPTAKVTVLFPGIGLKRVVARFLSPL